MLQRIEVFFIATMFIVVTAIILIVYTMEREQEFKAHNLDIQTAVVNGAAYAINQQLEYKRQHVRLFLDEYSRLFTHLIKYPDDTVNASNISRRLGQRFSDFFTYTITDQEGNPILSGLDTLVGEACQLDLNNYASKVSQHVNIENEVFVHPQPFHYHYDIMAPLVIDDISDGATDVDSTGIFFSSFHLDVIADILKTHEVPGQKLLLVRQSDPRLIEVSNHGARDKSSREIRLNDTELRQIRVFENISETDWRLIILPDTNFSQQYISGLWQEVIIILSIVTLALVILIMVMFRLSDNRNNN